MNTDLYFATWDHALSIDETNLKLVPSDMGSHFDLTMFLIPAAGKSLSEDWWVCKNGTTFGLSLADFPLVTSPPDSSGTFPVWTKQYDSGDPKSRFPVRSSQTGYTCPPLPISYFCDPISKTCVAGKGSPSYPDDPTCAGACPQGPVASFYCSNPASHQCLLVTPNNPATEFGSADECSARCVLPPKPGIYFPWYLTLIVLAIAAVLVFVFFRYILLKSK